MGLTASQSQRIDAIYQRSLPDRRRLRLRLAALEHSLKRMLTDGCSNPARTERLVNRVVEATRQSNVARELLLVQIFRELSPSQRGMLGELSSIHAGAP